MRKTQSIDQRYDEAHQQNTANHDAECARTAQVPRQDHDPAQEKNEEKEESSVREQGTSSRTIRNHKRENHENGPDPQDSRRGPGLEQEPADRDGRYHDAWDRVLWAHGAIVA